MDALTADDLTRIDRVVELFRQSRSLLFITGAGLSADSGLPAYRGVGGLYEDQHPERNIPSEEILSGEILAVRPELTWKYLRPAERDGAVGNSSHAACEAGCTRAPSTRPPEAVSARRGRLEC